nr:MAG TPA: hypothetical protein [Crassvirales sp.]
MNHKQHLINSQIFIKSRIPVETLTHVFTK